MKRMIRSNTTIQAATTDKEVLMRSNDGMFELVRREGVGVKDTPYTGLYVESLGDAYKYVVEIRLDSAWEDFNGPDHPVVYKYYGVEVAHGMRMERDSLKDTERYIKVLQSALDFARKLLSSKYISKS